MDERASTRVNARRLAYAGGLTLVWTIAFSLRPHTPLSLLAMLPAVAVLFAWLHACGVVWARLPFIISVVAIVAIITPIACWMSIVGLVLFLVHPTAQQLWTLALAAAMWLVAGYHFMGAAMLSDSGYKLPMDEAAARGSANVD